MTVGYWPVTDKYRYRCFVDSLNIRITQSKDTYNNVH